MEKRTNEWEWKAIRTSLGWVQLGVDRLNGDIGLQVGNEVRTDWEMVELGPFRAFAPTWEDENWGSGYVASVFVDAKAEAEALMTTQG